MKQEQSTKRTSTIAAVRGARGGALVEGVSGMLMMVIVLVAGVILVATVGIYMFYKIKVGFVANQAAQYAAGLVSWNNNYNPYLSTSPFRTPDQKVRAAVVQMCSQMGLPSPSAVTVNDTGPTVVCTVTVTGIAQPWGLPVPISVADTASADLTAYQPPAILQIHPQNATVSDWKYALPCYGHLNTLNLRNTPKYKFFFAVPGPASFY